METIGGGVVLEPNPKIKRRFQDAVIEELKRKESGSSADVIEMHVKAHADTAITIADLAKLTAMSPEEVTADVEELENQGLVHVFRMRKDTFVWHADSARMAVQTVTDALKKYEASYPYRYGMKKAELQMTYFKKVKPNVFDKIVELLEEKQAVKRIDEFMCTPEYEVRKDATYDKVSKILITTFTNAKYDFVRYSEIDMKGVSRDIADDILNILLEEQMVVKVTDDMYTLKSNMDSAKEVIQNKLKEDSLITIAQVRDIFSTSRKSAKPILEYMDSIKVTKKAGAETERIAY
jgi:selenocysteine-specific elongation factor